MPVKDLVGPSHQLTNAQREEFKREIKQLEEAIRARPYKLAVARSVEGFIKKIVRRRSMATVTRVMKAKDTKRRILRSSTGEIVELVLPVVVELVSRFSPDVDIESIKRHIHRLARGVAAKQYQSNKRHVRSLARGAARKTVSPLGKQLIATLQK